MDDENNASMPTFKQPVQTLTRKNWRSFFQDMQLWLTSKGTFYTCEYTEEEWCAVKTFQDGVDNVVEGINKIQLTPSSSGTNTPGGEKQESTKGKGLEPPKAIMNLDKQNTFRKDSAGAFFILLKCIDSFDRELLDEYDDNKAKWTALKSRYSKSRPADVRDYEKALTHWTKDPELSIDNSWTKLKELRRNLIEADPNIRIDQTKLFGYLMNGLPEEYKTLKTVLDAQPNLPIDEKLDVLQRFHEENNVRDLSALAARVKQSKKSRNRYSSPPPSPRSRYYSSSSGSDQHFACYTCDAPDHEARHCPYKREARRFARDLRVRSENGYAGSGSERSSSRASKQPSSGRHDSRGGETRGRPKSVKFDKTSRHRSKGKGKAYVADDVTDSGEIDISTESETVEEYANVSQDAASKISSSEWIPDTAASSHMTDQEKSFHGPLKSIPRRTIKVGGGRLSARHVGIAELRLKDGSFLRLKDCLYVPHLGANLLSARRVCANSKLEGAFDDKKMYFHENKKVKISASFRDGVYIVDHIATDDHEKAYEAQEVPQDAEAMDISSPVTSTAPTPQPTELPEATLKSDSDDGNPIFSRAEQLTRKRLERYKLWHRRFGHVGPNTIKMLHTVTTLKRPIKVPTELEVCDVCAITKMRKRISRILAAHKERKLALLSVDIAGPWPASMRGYKWFAEVIDNWSRKVWILLLVSKGDIIKELNKLATILERQTGEKILASRSDNAGEIQKILESWKTKDGVIPQSTATYSSNQNGPAERGIQTSENTIRAMLKDSQLPVEFWCYAAKADAHLRNRMMKGPTVKKTIDGVEFEKRISPEEAWTGQVPSIDHIHTFGCKAFAYVDPKSHPPHTRSDKLMDRGRECVFVGYNDDTTKQWKVYAPDLHRTVITSYAKFKESVAGGTLDLRLRIPLSGEEFIEGQGTPNVLADRKPRGRPKKAVPPLSSSSLAVENSRDSYHNSYASSRQEPQPLATKSNYQPPRVEDVIEVDVPQPVDSEDETQQVATAKKGRGRPRKSVGTLVPTNVTTGKANYDTDWKPTSKSTSQSQKQVAAGRKTTVDRVEKRETTRRSPRLQSQLEHIVDKVGLKNLEQRQANAARPVVENPAIVDATGPVSDALEIDGTKRKRNEPEDEADLPQRKILRAMMALLEELDTDEDDEEHAFLSEMLVSTAIHADIPIPKTYKQAVNDPVYGKMWREAIDEEVRSLQTNQTWEEVVPPAGADLVDSKWVFTVKWNPDGSLERFKARLVGRGFTQQYGVNYTETFAPTVQMTTLRTFFFYRRR
jgi:hypothetical protein